MISTNTKGVGNNRNIALMYATADYCMLADDDVVYNENIENIVLEEFEKFKDADIIIFNIGSTGSERKQRRINKSRKCRFWDRMSWGAVRMAVKLSSIRTKNIWFHTLFGGGCRYPSGEDSIFLLEARKKRLKIYLSNQEIGLTDFSKSSWFNGYDDNYYWGKGAFYQVVHNKSFYIRALYICFRTQKKTQLCLAERMRCLREGRRDYQTIGRVE